MITRINVNTNTRKNNPNFKMKFTEEQQMAIATANAAPCNRLITGISMGVFTKDENEAIIKKLMEKHDNGILRAIAKKFGILPPGK